MNDHETEQEIQAKGKTAPRITPADIEASIASEHYHSPKEFGEQAWSGNLNGELDTLTFCVLVLRNGFTVTGESACASPENFDAEIGRKIARDNAKQKIWMLEGYLLKEKLAFTSINGRLPKPASGHVELDNIGNDKSNW